MGGVQTVAAALERRLFSVLHHPVQVVAAGRTDAGVHARAMVFHFDAVPQTLPGSHRGTGDGSNSGRGDASTVRNGQRDGYADDWGGHVSKQTDESDLLARVLLRSGGGLPRALQVYAIGRAPENFHARLACLGKRYVYRVATGQSGAAMWELPFCWLLDGTPWLDIARMRSAAAALCGKHDFSAFSLAEKGDKSCADPRGPVRHLWRLEILHSAPRDDGCIGSAPTAAVSCRAGRINGQKAPLGDDGPQKVLIVLEGDRFLRKMARMLVGTLVQVGQPKQKCVASHGGSRKWHLGRRG